MQHEVGNVEAGWSKLEVGAGKGAPAGTGEPAAPGGGKDGKGKGKGKGKRRGALAPPALHGACGGLLAGLALLIAGASASAQAAQGLLVSLSADDALPFEAVRDQDVVFHSAGEAAHVCWPSETFALLTAETSALLHPVFTDVDAIHELPYGATGAQRMLVSIGTDEAGFKDGDVIAVGAGGHFEVHTAEAAFIAATGATDGNVDLDAYQLDADGGVVFSFGDNELSSFLSGDTAGTVKDGDILYWPTGAAAAQMLFTETQVNAFVTQALGVATSTTDTTGLARDPVTGDVLFSVQSPTSHDASVFSVAGGGSLYAGHAEADLGFTVGPELDGLCVAWTRFASVTTSLAKPAPGSTVVLQLQDATPGVPHLAFASLTLGPSQFPLAGWGGFVLTPDALLVASLSAAPSLLIVPDAMGRGTLMATLPLALGPVDVVVQVVSPGPDLMSSNPLLLELAQ
jgi:hypothetical protein